MATKRSGRDWGMGLERVYDFMAMPYKPHRHSGLDPESSGDVSKEHLASQWDTLLLDSRFRGNDGGFSVLNSIVLKSETLS
ncbi:hypothetical protein [Lampropedia hyalina]|jgi:hypothetical protein|uniref:hypothetical protein n=1 Tax=Lampropedia hyalina TaxID=198706 RepID=UPI001161369B|nr:hypothetical protein [Lampropedia hyalina]